MDTRSGRIFPGAGLAKLDLNSSVTVLWRKAGWVVMISPDCPDIYPAPTSNSPAFKPGSSLLASVLVTMIMIEKLKNLNKYIAQCPIRGGHNPNSQSVFTNLHFRGPFGSLEYRSTKT